MDQAWNCRIEIQILNCRWQWLLLEIEASPGPVQRTLPSQCLKPDTRNCLQNNQMCKPKSLNNIGEIIKDSLRKFTFMWFVKMHFPQRSVQLKSTEFCRGSSFIPWGGRICFLSGALGAILMKSSHYEDCYEAFPPLQKGGMKNPQKNES